MYCIIIVFALYHTDTSKNTRMEDNCLRCQCLPMLLVRNSSILTQIVIVVLLKLNHNGSELEMFIIVYFRSDF